MSNTILYFLISYCSKLFRRTSPENSKKVHRLKYSYLTHFSIVFNYLSMNITYFKNIYIFRCHTFKMQVEISKMLIYFKTGDIYFLNSSHKYTWIHGGIVLISQS